MNTMLYQGISALKSMPRAWVKCREAIQWPRYVNLLMLEPQIFKSLGILKSNSWSIAHMILKLLIINKS